MSANEAYFGLTPLAFNALMQTWAHTVPEEEHDTIFKKIALDALTKLTLKTPVLTGRARGNWQVTVGSPSQASDPSKIDPSGGQANDSPNLEYANRTGGDRVIGEGAVTVLDAKSSDIIWISNNVPYIVRLEEGHSGQAPTGMLQNTINELEVVFK